MKPRSRWLRWWAALTGQTGPAPLTAPAVQPLATAEPVYPKIGLLILDPLLPAAGGQRLSQAAGWNDPHQLVRELIAELAEVSYGCVRCQLVQTAWVDEFLPMQDGFRYTDRAYLQALAGQGTWHQPDRVDYAGLLRRDRLVDQVNAGELDEIWTIGHPYAGFYESRMAGPDAFWCNAPPLAEDLGLQRRVVVMAFNYQRGLGEMLESYGHRAESILAHVYRDLHGEPNHWERFTRYDRTHPGQAEVGSLHFAPNSQRDYDWGNPRTVRLHHSAWLSYPDLSAESRWGSCQEWGCGDIRAHHRWWFQHLPHFTGSTNGIRNNWWSYVADPNQVP